MRPEAPTVNIAQRIQKRPRQKAVVMLTNASEDSVFACGAAGLMLYV